MKRVYIDGIFDMFHRGHLESFKKAKSIYGCDKYDDVTLIVGVVSDKDAQLYKRKPIINEDDRCEILLHIDLVDEVIFPVPLSMTKEFLIDNKLDMVVHSFRDDVDWNKQEEYFKVPIKMKKFKRIEYYKPISTTQIINTFKRL